MQWDIDGSGEVTGAAQAAEKAKGQLGWAVSVVGETPISHSHGSRAGIPINWEDCSMQEGLTCGKSNMEGKHFFYDAQNPLVWSTDGM